MRPVTAKAAGNNSGLVASTVMPSSIVKSAVAAVQSSPSCQHGQSPEENDIHPQELRLPELRPIHLVRLETTSQRKFQGRSGNDRHRRAPENPEEVHDNADQEEVRAAVHRDDDNDPRP